MKQCFSLKSILTIGACALLTAACQPHQNPDTAPPGNADDIPIVDPSPEFERDSVDARHQSTTDVHTMAARINPEFAAMLRDSGIGAELSTSDGLYTVFVPSPDVFDPMMMTGSDEEKRKLLRYYVVPGRMTSSELTNLQEVPSATGQPLDIRADAKDQAFAVNQAWVTQPNVAATNGVVHVIDSMLLPPDHPYAPMLRNDSPTAYILVDATIANTCDIRQPKAYFRFDSANLKPGVYSSLSDLAECVTEGPLMGQQLLLEGHTDPRGSEDYNQTLGRQRAKSVRQYLVAEGVKRGQMSVVSHGEEFAHDERESYWDRDRRVDIRLASPITR